MRTEYFDECALCGDKFDESHEDMKHEDGHIIPKGRGGCDHFPNLYGIHRECNRGQNEQGTLTPLELWAKHEWKIDQEDPNDVSAFDAGGYTLAQRRDELLRAAYWEARAR